MLTDAIGASQEDMVLRSLREAQVDARRLLDATEAAMTQGSGAADNSGNQYHSTSHVPGC